MVKAKVKVHTLDIAPLRSESPPQKRSGKRHQQKYKLIWSTAICADDFQFSYRTRTFVIFYVRMKIGTGLFTKLL